MALSAADAAKFWLIYSEYDAQLTKLNDRRIENIKQYARDYDQMTDEEADQLVQKSMTYQKERAELFAQTYEKVKQALGAVTAARFAQEHATIVALTGDIDIVTDGERNNAVANGDPLMSLVTAMGCAGAALVAAALAVESDAWLATLAALAAFGVAGEVAAQGAQGPGSFAVAMIDALHGIDRGTLRARVKAS